ncbi:hypothetical protein GCM10011578_084310 [Streptomyces fuscichromogenes]|uniref:Uncharacterized protein n=1 Tax=Streptomyces fuscichromogenes TaxID=1324013 RepID=A0A917XM79_9ACTN|nr:hypothetical protein GCM10011578_084310 [Streptomyces fuscichromogenes]
MHDVLGALPITGDQPKDIRKERSGVLSVEGTHQLLIRLRGLGHAMSGPRSTFIGHGRILAHAHLRCPGVPPVGRSPTGTEVTRGVFNKTPHFSAR